MGAASECAAHRWDASCQRSVLGLAAAADTSAAADSPAVEVDTGLVAAAGLVAEEHTDLDCYAEADRTRRTAACSVVDSGHGRLCERARMPASEHSQA